MAPDERHKTKTNDMKRILVKKYKPANDEDHKRSIF